MAQHGIRCVRSRGVGKFGRPSHVISVSCWRLSVLASGFPNIASVSKSDRNAYACHPLPISPAAIDTALSNWAFTARTILSSCAARRGPQAADRAAGVRAAASAYPHRASGGQARLGQAAQFHRFRRRTASCDASDPRQIMLIARRQVYAECSRPEEADAIRSHSPARCPCASTRLVSVRKGAGLSDACINGRAGVRCGQASEKRPCTRSRWGGQSGAAAYGDSAIAELAVMPMTLHPALQDATARHADWR
jgi:hypothetical protein